MNLTLRNLAIFKSGAKVYATLWLWERFVYIFREYRLPTERSQNMDVIGKLGGLRMHTHVGLFVCAPALINLFKIAVTELA